MLQNLARFCVRRRREMVGFWLLLLVALGVAAGSMGSSFSTEFELPKSEANDVQQLLEANSPDRAGFSGEIVFTSPAGVVTDEIKAAMATMFSEVGALSGVTVTSPFDVEGQINPAGTTAFASLDVTIRSQTELITLSEEIQKIGEKVEIPNFTIEYGGNIFAEFELPASAFAIS